jgi:hypothetical protein
MWVLRTSLQVEGSNADSDPLVVTPNRNNKYKRHSRQAPGPPSTIVLEFIARGNNIVSRISDVANTFTITV